MATYSVFLLLMGFSVIQEISLHDNSLNQNIHCKGSEQQSKFAEDIMQQMAALQTKVQALHAGQQQMATQRAKIHTQHQQLTTLKAQVVALKSAFTKSQVPVGFHVALTARQSRLGTMAFDDIINHYGNCWNHVTKKFVAPTTGLYSFDLTLMTPGGREAYAEIMHGNRILQKAWADGHCRNNVAVANAVVRVRKGEQVYVRLVRNTAHSNRDHWTNFVGFLIQQI